MCYPPAEVDLWSWVEFYKQTPFQLGLSETNDVSLWHRAVKIYHAYQLGQRHTKEVENLSIDEGLLLGKIYDAIRAKRISRKLLYAPEARVVSINGKLKLNANK